MKPLEEGRGLERMLLIYVLMNAAIGVRGNRKMEDVLREELRTTLMLSSGFIESGEIPRGGEEGELLDNAMYQIMEKYGDLVDAVANRYRRAA
jgi:hypothetical protein